MLASSEPSPPIRSPRSRRRSSKWSLRLTPGGVLFLLLVDLLVLAVLAWPVLKARLAVNTTPTANPTGETPAAHPSATISPSPQLVSQLTATPSPLPITPTAPVTASSAVAEPTLFNRGFVIFSLDEGDNRRLFLYPPGEGEMIDKSEEAPPGLTRLIYGPWDDISPALSPDGKKLAFVSNRNGYWDIYILDLLNAEVTRLTDSLEYDGAPSWSPDGLWLAYETYLDDNLEVMIRSVADPTQLPIRLTNNAAADHSPAWSPQGRRIAFVSNRSGDPEIWVADLDQANEENFENLSRNPVGAEAHPAWSPDGNILVWSVVEAGFHNLYLQNLAAPFDSVRYVGSGDWPVWSQDGKTILTLLLTPGRDFITAYAYDLPEGTPPILPADQQAQILAGSTFPTLALPPLALPGTSAGLTWGKAELTWPLQEPYRQAAAATRSPLWQPIETPRNPGSRMRVVALQDIQAPFAYLHDQVDDSFQALRSRLAGEIGWDFLSALENAYVPLTAALDPGMGDDWLYTGRAFTVNTQPINAGWMAVVREEFGQQTYWRVFLRARFQDGSAGEPLLYPPWEFNARYDGSVGAYEQGGALSESIPAGYWFDFTRLAANYGWERLPALLTWRTSYPAARFNEFAFINHLDWRSAMLQIYPPEALITPSPVVLPSQTLTITPRWYQTPTYTPTLTPRPTRTPIVPSLTPSATPTSTSVPSLTPSATASPTATTTRTRTPSPRSSRTPTRTATPVEEGDAEATPEVVE